MFGDKCSSCDKRISKKYDFCPHCGKNVHSSHADEDYGFLGKEDFEDFGIKLPFGFKTMIKPLMKELNKQLIELDKEVKRNQKSENPNSKTVKNFSVSFGVPGQKPIKMVSSPESNIQLKPQKKVISLPSIDKENLALAKSFPRIEPGTSVRRLSDKVIYEISLPGVKLIKDLGINKLENALEIKAIGKDEVFVKTIEMSLPLKDHSFNEEILVLEFDLK